MPGRPPDEGRVDAVTRWLRVGGIIVAATQTLIMLAVVIAQPTRLPERWGAIAGEPRDVSAWELFAIAAVLGGLAITILLVSAKPRWFSWTMLVTKTNAQDSYLQIEQALVMMGLGTVVMQATAVWLPLLRVEFSTPVVVIVVLMLMAVIVAGAVLSLLRGRRR